MLIANLAKAYEGYSLFAYACYTAKKVLLGTMRDPPSLHDVVETKALMKAFHV